MNWRTLIAAGYMNRYGNGFTKMDLRDSTSIRNYELIKQIYKMASDYPYPIAIKELIEEQRPELKKEK